ncbi:D-2-hydroxyacid dehydrogenase [Sulfitobacter pacificus]|uniref:Glycerate dehydrogenase n=1 Tax=Sulfitobacter pacificus TaxID=1499314 RepID=A0ABQ5VMV4_9RHOB|nr:D-2-hydroxyacid dehydrogenase [Sulfitobacter pacificus]GLQ28445.1 glycerate dehydrogenase [Sulfitobacter pacificus]
MTKIVFLDRETIGPGVILNRPQTDHEWVEYQATAEAQVLERAKDADVIITNKVPIGETTLAGLPNLKMIAIAATGYDVVDVAACSNRGIIVSNVRGYAINTVPEHAFALIFALQRNIVGYRQDVIDGAWQKSGQFCFFTHPIRDLSGARLGILGEGVIGQSVARIGRALGMDVVFASHKGVEGLGPLYTPWDEVMETSDVLTLHAPLMPATRNMISTPEFEAMKRKPIIINTSRGGLVDEAAMVDALDRGLISGIGFDVLTSEPPQPDNPILQILDRPNVIVTPHVAWASTEARQTLWDQVAHHIDNFLTGQPSNVVG